MHDVRVREQQHRVEPRGLSRTDAASYIGVSTSLFDVMVKDGRMPQPKRINARTVWDKRQLDDAFDALPGGYNEEDEDWNVAV
jgi:predicted DNA-binding transcriptional regulator AlpA